MTKTFTPLHRALRGQVLVPGDKSISHRAVLFSAAAEGTSHLSGVLDSADVRSSMAVTGALSAQVFLSPDETGALCGTVTGWGKNGPISPEEPLNCGNSGTTARLLLGLLSGCDVKAELTGDASLSKRPMSRVTVPLARMGATFSPEGQETLPLRVQGKKGLSPISYHSPVASAQLKTALLLAALGAYGTACVSEPVRSRDHTERMLPAFGIPVTVEDTTVALTGPATLHAANVRVPGDPSSAAFLLAAAAMVKNSEVTVENVSLNETRLGFLQVMRRMGVHMYITQTGLVGNEPVGNITVVGDGNLAATVVPASEIASLIDEVPILALLATAASGVTCFEGVGELRVKESDRLTAIVDGLTSLGCIAYARGENLYIEGGLPNKDAELSAQGDHRLAMCWALAGLCFDISLTLDDFECTSVSYPNFYNDVMKLSEY